MPPENAEKSRCVAGRHGSHRAEEALPSRFRKDQPRSQPWNRDDSSQAESVQHPGKRRLGMRQERPCERQFDRGEAHLLQARQPVNEERDAAQRLGRAQSHRPQGHGWHEDRGPDRRRSCTQSARCVVLARGNGSFPADQPLTLGQELVERPSAEHVEAIKEVAQCETQQVQKARDQARAAGC